MSHVKEVDFRLDCPEGLSESEWELRVKLAYCYHLVDFFGWTETIFNHISARIPGEESYYLVNPFGLNYTEVTPENLLKVDLDGQKVEPSDYDANPAGFALHSAIHGARDDIHCVVHTHTNEVSAIAQKKSGFAHDDFYGAQLYNRVGYHTFEGITLFGEERQRMLDSLGSKHVLVLRNHGIAVGEANIERTFFLLWTVQRAAEIQVAAGSLGGEDNPIEDNVKSSCAELTQKLINDGGFAVKFYRAMVRKLVSEKGMPW